MSLHRDFEHVTKDLNQFIKRLSASQAGHIDPLRDVDPPAVGSVTVDCNKVLDVFLSLNPQHAPHRASLVSSDAGTPLFSFSSERWNNTLGKLAS